MTVATFQKGSSGTITRSLVRARNASFPSGSASSCGFQSLDSVVIKLTPKRSLAQENNCVSVDDFFSEIERDNPGLSSISEKDEIKGVYQSFFSDEKALFALRLSKGFSQSALAEAAGTSQSAIARIESGETDPRISTVRKIAEALGCSSSDILEALSCE